MLCIAITSSPLLSLRTSSVNHHRPFLFPRFSSLRSNKVKVSLFSRNPAFLLKRRTELGICRADLSQDAPFAFAIGACILNSLIFPVSDSSVDDQSSAIDSNDARFAVMGIISFIPYFNWMSWAFAWLDTNRQRYLVYSIVYLAPYLRTNLSLSPDESWLPIASIVLCIAHIQLEASIKSGDFQSFQMFGESIKRFSEKKGKDTRWHDSHGVLKKGRNKDSVEVPEESENKLRRSNGWEEEDRHKEEKEKN